MDTARQIDPLPGDGKLRFGNGIDPRAVFVCTVIIGICDRRHDDVIAGACFGDIFDLVLSARIRSQIICIRRLAECNGRRRLRRSIAVRPAAYGDGKRVFRLDDAECDRRLRKGVAVVKIGAARRRLAGPAVIVLIIQLQYDVVIADICAARICHDRITIIRVVLVCCERLARIRFIAENRLHAVACGRFIGIRRHLLLANDKGYRPFGIRSAVARLHRRRGEPAIGRCRDGYIHIVVAGVRRYGSADLAAACIQKMIGDFAVAIIAGDGQDIRFADGQGAVCRFGHVAAIRPAALGYSCVVLGFASERNAEVELSRDNGDGVLNLSVFLIIRVC